MIRIMRIAPLALMALVVSFLAGTTVASAAPSLVRGSVAYGSFSPDRDGYRDTLPITYRLSKAARASVKLYRNGVLVRTLKASSYQRAGTYTLRWNGRTGSGASARTATYRWVVSARRGTTTSKAAGNVSLGRVALPTDRWVGFYVPGVPHDTEPLSTLETVSGVQAKVSNYYQNTIEGFTRDAAANAIARGYTPLITLEFWDPAAGVDQPGFSLGAINSGAWDEYLHRYARDAAAFGQTVWLRPLHEMNGNWYPWGGTVNGNVPGDFVPAWRHIHDIFVEEGAANVRFVWSPSSDSIPNTAENTFAAYWPGDAYVDYIAFDGYNFGTSATWSTWRSFSETFGAAYTKVTALSAKPMFIAETGSTTSGGDKAAWIADMFDVIPQRFPRLQGVCWFNVDKETDWRVESSPATLSSFRIGAVSF